MLIRHTRVLKENTWHFNTSHVNVNPYLSSFNLIINMISIHLMLMLINLNLAICHAKLNFNTSHVNVNQVQEAPESQEIFEKFQYISC